MDIGTGIPAAGNTHEVAQSVAPECRIAYVDNDPIVLAHARALLSSSPAGACAYLDADLKEVARILEEAARTPDFSQPVAVLFIGVLHLVPEDEDPYGIVTEMVRATVPGSYLALTQPAKDISAEMVAEGARRYNEHVKVRQTRRTHTETLRFFDGMRLMPPGLVQCHRWRPDPGAIGLNEDVSCYAGVAAGSSRATSAPAQGKPLASQLAAARRHPAFPTGTTPRRSGKHRKGGCCRVWFAWAAGVRPAGAASLGIPAVVSAWGSYYTRHDPLELTARSAQ